LAVEKRYSLAHGCASLGCVWNWQPAPRGETLQFK